MFVHKLVVISLYGTLEGKLVFFAANSYVYLNRSLGTVNSGTFGKWILYLSLRVQCVFAYIVRVFIEVHAYAGIEYQQIFCW